jgi:hypothetical protein
VSAAARAMMMMTGASRSSGAPSAANRAISAVTRVVVTATVWDQDRRWRRGPSCAPATIEALIAGVMKVAAIPLRAMCSAAERKSGPQRRDHRQPK